MANEPTCMWIGCREYNFLNYHHQTAFRFLPPQFRRYWLTHFACVYFVSQLELWPGVEQFCNVGISTWSQPCPPYICSSLIYDARKDSEKPNSLLPQMSQFECELDVCRTVSQVSIDEAAFSFFPDQLYQYCCTHFACVSFVSKWSLWPRVQCRISIWSQPYARCKWGSLIYDAWKDTEECNLLVQQTSWFVCELDVWRKNLLSQHLWKMCSVSSLNYIVTVSAILLVFLLFPSGAMARSVKLLSNSAMSESVPDHKFVHL